jgi:hypothetical protein
MLTSSLLSVVDDTTSKALLQFLDIDVPEPQRRAVVLEHERTDGFTELALELIEHQLSTPE